MTNRHKPPLTLAACAAALVSFAYTERDAIVGAASAVPAAIAAQVFSWLPPLAIFTVAVLGGLIVGRAAAAAIRWMSERKRGSLKE